MRDVLKKKFDALVLKSEIVAKGVKKITFKLSEEFSFFPWQYVWVEIPDMKISDQRGSRRAFSIFNTINSDNTIEIVARISDSGYKQNLFALDVGERVIIHGPFGNSFVIDEEHQPENVFMIAGGVGIAAFLPMIRTVKNKSYRTKCFLVYLNKEEEATPFLKELEDLKKSGNFFDYKVKYDLFSWEDVASASSGLKGSIEWWIAGPQGMVDHVFKELESGGVSRVDMFFENFYPVKKGNLTLEAVNAQLQGNNFFAKGIQNSTNHTVITDAEGTVLFANKAAEAITGYTLQEMIGNTPRLWGGMMSRDFYIDFWRQKVSGKPFVGQVTNRRKNGEIYYAMAHIAPIFGETNEIIGFIGTEEDITERVKLETKIAESQNFLDSIIKNLPNMVFVKDSKDLKFVLFNKAGEDLTGFSAKEILGKSDRDFFPKEQADFFIRKDMEVLQTKQMTDIPEELIDTKYKGKRILHTRKMPIFDLEGNPKYLLGISEDVTDEKKRRDELEKLNKVMIGRELKMVELKKILKNSKS